LGATQNLLRMNQSRSGFTALPAVHHFLIALPFKSFVKVQPQKSAVKGGTRFSRFQKHP
jgi:hypothetical protein